jgi:hypothetical protein
LQISHIADERIPALSGTAGPFRIDTLHRARVIGHSPLDGILLLSFEQKVLDQVFMQVDELKVGQHLKVSFVLRHVGQGADGRERSTSSETRASSSTLLGPSTESSGQTTTPTSS